MSLVPAARRTAKDPKADPLLRDTLTYLLKHGVGRDSACPIDEVLAHLRSLGHSMTRAQFQHKVLVPTREPPSDIFIASYGAFGRGGIYLIAGKADAQPMIDFYNKRIRSEQRHLDHLESLL